MCLAARPPRAAALTSRFSRLAGAVGTEQAKGDPTRNGEVDAIERFTVAELLRQPGGLHGQRRAVCQWSCHGEHATGARPCCRHAEGAMRGLPRDDLNFGAHSLG
jgi:hypothetical protein